MSGAESGAPQSSPRLPWAARPREAGVLLAEAQPPRETRKSDPGGGESRGRKSDPGSGGARALVAGSPTPLRQRPSPRGWEYPLSREEKKHRVLELYQRELVEVHAGREEADGGRPTGCEAGRAARRAAAVSPARNVPDAAGAATSLSSGCRRLRGAAGGPWSPAPRPGTAALAAAALACTAALLAARPPSPTTLRSRAGARAGAPAGEAGWLRAEEGALAAAGGDGWRALLPNASVEAASASTQAAAAAAAASPNTSATARRLRDAGLAKLSASECSEAHWYFASALELLMVGSGGLAERDVEVRGLLGHQGFALVCDEKFREGAALLEHHIRSEGLTEGTAHLLNALGFARFRMGDYERAELAFEAGSRAEPQNPIMWNNLAAVKMMRGRLGEADGAMYQALDRTLPGQRGKEAQWVVGDYHRWMFQSNAVNLASRASGAKAGMPQVDLWWAERPAAKK